jgi:hypothetical protein
MWRSLYFHNERFDQGMRNALRSGIVHINHGTGLVEPLSASMDYNSNWLFFGYTTSLRDCYLWHQIMFECFGLVPEFCRLRCYKVVVKIRNFLEAIQFYNVMNAGMLIRSDLVPIHGKVGIDERFYSSGHFNGFVYCDGLEDALEKYVAVRELVNTQIDDGENIPIIIKRTCTEFERRHGPTDTPFWQSMSKDDLDLQHHIEDIFRTVQGSAVQPDWLKNKIITKMAKWANTVGDKSWLDYFEGDDILTMQAVTYHHLIDKKEAPMETIKPKEIINTYNPTKITTQGE